MYVELYFHTSLDGNTLVYCFNISWQRAKNQITIVIDSFQCTGIEGHNHMMQTVDLQETA